MTFADLQALFYLLYRQKSTNTSISTTNAKILLNQAYYVMCSNMQWTILETMLTRSIAYSTVASRASATSYTVADGTNFYTGQEICVWDTGGNHYYARISNKSTNTLTLTSPGIPYTHDAGDYVAGVTYYMPDNVGVSNVVWRNVTSTEAEAKRLRPLTMREWLKDEPYVKSTGDPNVYVYTQYLSSSGEEFKIFPVPDAVGYLDIYYRTKVTTALSGDSDTPSIEPLYHSAIVYLALVYAGIRDRDPDLVKLGQDMYTFEMRLAQELIGSRIDVTETFDLAKGITD